MHWRQYQELQKLVEIGDRFISYVDAGSGPPLVLLHGMPSWGYLWHRLVPVLERSRRVIVPDLPGFGFSDRSDRFDRSIARQAQRLAAFLQALGIERADLVGHDIGGAIALRLALLQPQRVGRLGLVDTVCYDSWPIPELLALADPANARRLSLIATQKLLRRELERGFASVDEEIVEGLLAPFSTELGQLALIRAASALDTNLTMELVPLLPGLEASTLLLWGEQDAFQPLSYARRLAWELPRARLSVIPGAGHYAMIDKPGELLAQLESFLAGASEPLAHPSRSSAQAGS